MKDYKNKSGFNRNGPSRPAYGPRKFGAFSDRPREMHKAECSQCHNPCEVPFVPNGKKPVFCSNCFVKDGDDAPRDSYPRRDFAPRPAFKREAPAQPDRGMADLAYQMKAMNEKLDRLVRVMESSVVTAPKAEVTSEPVKARKTAKKPVSKKK